MKPASDSDQCSGFERTEFERVEVEPLLDLRVRREEDLKASVELISVDAIGADSPADAIGGFEDLKGHPGPSQVLRAGESGKARTDNHDVDHGSVAAVVVARGQRQGRDAHHPWVPGSPLKGPTTRLVIQPP